jgi:hypothetical protein
MIMFFLLDSNLVDYVQTYWGTRKTVSAVSLLLLIPLNSVCCRGSGGFVLDTMEIISQIQGGNHIHDLVKRSNHAWFDFSNRFLKGYVPRNFQPLVFASIETTEPWSPQKMKKRRFEYGIVFLKILALKVGKISFCGFNNETTNLNHSIKYLLGANAN